MSPDELLEKVVAVLDRLGIPYVVTGSMASMAYGEPRLTNDIDIVAALGAGTVGAFVRSFPGEEYYLSEDAAREAVRSRDKFNIIHPASGLKVDVFVKGETAFEESQFSRFKRIRATENFEANFAAPEDVIVKKLEYYKSGGSDKHLRDITGILKVSGEEVDRSYIDAWATRLDVLEVWHAVLEKLE